MSKPTPAMLDLKATTQNENLFAVCVALPDLLDFDGFLQQRRKK